MAYRSISTNQGTSSTSLTVSVPSGVQDGDILILAVTVDAAAATITGWPSGFQWQTVHPGSVGNVIVTQLLGDT